MSHGSKGQWERMMARSARWIATFAACVAMAGSSLAMAAASSYPSQTAYPNEDAKGVSLHLSRARALAGSDLWSEFRWRCLISPLDRQQVMAVQHNGLVPATRVFDNLYSIGQNAVSAYALDTAEGIIVIDALNSPEEARDILVPNMVQLGLDPRRIRYVIVTHGHGDHYGGAKYLQDSYGARVAASEADWSMMERAQNGPGPFAGLVPPRRDIIVKDGDTITLGKTRVQLAITPGHTPGALSLIFPVFDKGRPHMAGLMGGTGGGQDAASIRQQIASLQRWERLTRAAGVDVLVTNHPSHMDAIERQALIRYAQPGDTNPFIYGQARYQRYMQVMSECSRVQLARFGESAD